jgi:hypothetical protein
MFQFGRLAFQLALEYPDFIGMGCPIRISTDQRLFAPSRGLTQLVTSFIASESQGIHRTPLVTFLIYFNLVLSYNNIDWLVVFSFNMSKNFPILDF